MRVEGFRIERHRARIYIDAVSKQKGACMKLKMMKRSIAVLAAAFAAMSTNALAENTPPKTLEPMVSKAIQLNDTELDAITAGTLSITLLLITPGKGSVFYTNETTRLICINCAEFIDPVQFPKGKSAYGVISIEKTGRRPFVFTRPIGNWPSN